MSQDNNLVNKMDGSKKTVLPFTVHRAPLQNHLAYEKKGHWTQKEKLKYVIFLSYFKENFTSKDKKKRFCRIFKVMSDFIKTRTHNQCRSHHQKMEKQRFQVNSIIKNVVSRYHPRVYLEQYERYLIEIQNLNLDEQQEFKIRNINQNQLKCGSESNLDLIKNHDRRQLNQMPKEKHQSKKIEYLHPTLKTKIEEEAPILSQKTILNKRELRMTQECQDDQEFQMEGQVMRYKFPPENKFFSENQKSLDFDVSNNLIGLEMKDEKHLGMGFPDYLENLEMKKIQSFSKATYHYNQMQMELANVAECEKEKSVILERQKERLNSQNGFNFGFSNFFWGFQDLHKSF